MRDEKVKVLKAIPAIDPKNVVRGQFVGYLDEKGVAKDSKVETFAALQLEIKSWRWDGVPFYIRAGKNLPVTCTEVMARLRKPPTTNMTRRRGRAAELYAVSHQSGDDGGDGGVGLISRGARAP